MKNRVDFPLRHMHGCKLFTFLLPLNFESISPVPLANSFSFLFNIFRTYSRTKLENPIKSFLKCDRKIENGIVFIIKLETRHLFTFLKEVYSILSF